MSHRARRTHKFIPTILDDLPACLAKNNPHADETLQAFGMDVGSMGQQINKIRLPWDHAAQEEDALRVRRD
jgi:hypothetical protein